MDSCVSRVEIDAELSEAVTRVVGGDCAGTNAAVAAYAACGMPPRTPVLRVCERDGKC